MADNTHMDIAKPPVQPSSALAQHNASDSDCTLDVEESPSSAASKADGDIPPDGGYGWVCVACNFFINAHSWGVNSSYSVFLAYYLNNNYFPNTSPLAYAFIGGLSISMAMLIAPIATKVVHSYSTKVCLYVGVFFQTLSLVSASFAHREWEIILAQGVCFGWGMGFLFVGSVGVLPQWFTKKRSVANAIASAGSGFGGLIYSLSTQRMIDRLGLPWAFRILGILTFIVNLTASSLLKDRNSQVGSRHKAFDIVLLKRPEFLLLQGWSFFSMLGYTVVLFSLPSYARAIGLSAQQGSIVGAVLNLGQMLGRPFIGLASDRWGRLNLATLFSILCGVFCFAFWIPAEIASSPMGLLCFFAIVGGSMAGTFWCTIAPVGAEVVGLRDLPAGLSLTWVLTVPPTTFAEPIALELRRHERKDWIYLYAQVFTAMMYVAAGVCLWVVRGWKVGEVEEVERRIVRARVRESPADRLGEEAEEKAAIDDEDRIRRTRSESIPEAGWQTKDLLRRMFTPKIV